MGAINREAAAIVIRQCYTATNMKVTRLDTMLLMEALELYEARPDKTWSLTDCISFLVMQELGLTIAVTTDHHFEQAGYQILMIDDD